MSFIALAMSSVLVIQQCVLNEASEQKCTQNKTVYRRPEKKWAQGYTGAWPSVTPLGNGSVFTASLCHAFIEHSIVENMQS